MNKKINSKIEVRLSIIKLEGKSMTNGKRKYQTEEQKELIKFLIILGAVLVLIVGVYLLSKVFAKEEVEEYVYQTGVVSTDAVIKNLSSKLQTKIKEKVKNATDLEVKEVNIKIKNVAPKKEIES